MKASRRRTARSSAELMPGWMKVIDHSWSQLGRFDKVRVKAEGSGLDSRGARQPWSSKPVVLKDEIKAVVEEFKKVKSPEAERRSIELQESDQTLARDVLIADLHSRIDNLKRKINENRSRNLKTITKMQTEHSELTVRMVELESQNNFFREAIIAGRLTSGVPEERVLRLLDSTKFGAEDEEEWLEDGSPGSTSPKSPLLNTLLTNTTTTSFSSPTSGIMRKQSVAFQVNDKQFGSIGSPTAQNSLAHRRRMTLSVSTIGGRAPVNTSQLVNPQDTPDGFYKMYGSNRRKSMVALRGTMLAQLNTGSSDNRSQGGLSESETESTPRVDIGDEALSASDTWLSTYSQVLEGEEEFCSRQVSGAEGADSDKFSALYPEVESLLSGATSTRKFRELVDSVEPRTRIEMLRLVAKQFQVMGIMLRVMHSVQRMAQSSLDLNKTCTLFVSEIKSMVNAESVRLWLVDARAALIWEWTPGDENPVKRPFMMSDKTPEANPGRKKKRSPRSRAEELASWVARTGSVKESAKFFGAQAAEPDMQVLCEPIKRKGVICAVVQCIGKRPDEQPSEGEEVLFSSLDRHALKLIADQSGVLFRRSFVLKGTIEMIERTFNIVSLVRNFPCDEEDLFSLVHVQLEHSRNLLHAEHCVLYITAGLKTNRLWTLRSDGLGTRMEIQSGDGVAGWVAEREESLILANPESDKRFDFRIDTAFAAGTDEHHRTWRVNNLLAMPLKQQDGLLLGVCIMLNKSGTNFLNSDERLFQTHCQQVILSLSMRRQIDKDDGGIDTNETVSEAIDRCKMLVLCKNAFLFAKDPNSHNLVLENPRIIVPLTDGLLGYVARTGVSVSIKDVAFDPRFDPGIDSALDCKTTSLMCVPVRTAGDSSSILGVLVLSNKRGNLAFSEQDKVLATVLAKQVGQLYLAGKRKDVRKCQTLLQVSDLDGRATPSQSPKRASSSPGRGSGGLSPGRSFQPEDHEITEGLSS